MQTVQLLCWSGMTDTEHTASTRSSNKKKVHYNRMYLVGLAMSNLFLPKNFKNDIKICFI